MTTDRHRAERRDVETGQVRVRDVAIDRLLASPENDRIYRPVDPHDPGIQALADSIREHGVMEPLVVTEDNFIVSGHRRHAAARLAGLDTVPCRVEPIRRRADPDAFVVRLREHNRQREKTVAEKLNEEVISADPDEAYISLIAHRAEQSEIAAPKVRIERSMQRSRISDAKMPMLEAIEEVLERLHRFLPISERAIHYQLLNDPPLRHASKPNSHYRNDRASSKDLSDLVTRARIFGLLPMDAICDETRPVDTWDLPAEPGEFIRNQLDGFLKNYWRDLMQSQPNHVEIVAEKLAVRQVVRPVAMDYTIPLTIGRGFSSLPPRLQMVERFERSGKDKLVLVIVSDFDPEGEEIVQSFARSIRDDFGVNEHRIHCVKAALTREQIERFGLPPDIEAKTSSVNFKRFASRHGRFAYELEALEPDQLQAALREAIDAVIDVDRFNDELDAEKQDATYLQVVRERAKAALMGVGELDHEDDTP